MANMEANGRLPSWGQFSAIAALNTYVDAETRMAFSAPSSASEISASLDLDQQATTRPGWLSCLGLPQPRPGKPRPTAWQEQSLDLDLDLDLDLVNGNKKKKDGEKKLDGLRT
jgi:hypothetical protein